MRTLTLATAFLILSFGHAFAYVGPGLGLGPLGAILGVILAVFLAFLGLIYYPIKRFLRRNNEKPKTLKAKEATSENEPQ